MSERKIAVVSKNRELSELLATEAYFWGLATDRIEKASAAGEYSLIFWDSDSVSAFPAGLNGRLIVLRRGEETAESEESVAGATCLPLPLSLAALHGIFEALRFPSAQESGAPATVPGDTSLRLWRSGQENIVRYSGKNVHLTPNEADLLCLLGEAEGALVSREKISALLGAEKGNMSDVYICRLRRKLEHPFERKLIETVRGRGYRLKVPLVTGQ